MSVLSCILLAELAVGRIMRARKESSGDRDVALLTREPGLSEMFAAGAKDACEAALRMVEVVCRRLAAGPFAGGTLRVVSPVARLPGREASDSAFNLAADVAVEAAGIRTGRVGDLSLPLILLGEVLDEDLPPWLSLESPEGWALAFAGGLPPAG